MGEGRTTVSKRMSLVEGMKRDKEVQEVLDPTVVESFLKQENAKPKVEQAADAELTVQLAPPPLEEKRAARSLRPSKSSAVLTPGLIPVNVRVRPDLAAALQTASLQRQMEGLEPSSKREIVEQALEPWLRQHGFLS